jgi:hypothetical protein
MYTNASILTEARFACLKHRSNLYVVGVAGFSRPWAQLGLYGTALEQTIADVRATLCYELTDRQHRHGARLVVASGATNSGMVPLAYEVCTFLNITAMGIAPDQALEYPLSQMQYMLPFGQAFGDESPVFVRTIDELIVVGGGAQSQRELLAAAEIDRPITIIQGFGGVADEFSPAALPKAHFVRRISTTPRLRRTTNDQRPTTIDDRPKEPRTENRNP